MGARFTHPKLIPKLGMALLRLLYLFVTYYYYYYKWRLLWQSLEFYWGYFSGEARLPSSDSEWSWLLSTYEACRLETVAQTKQSHFIGPNYLYFVWFVQTSYSQFGCCTMRGISLLLSFVYTKECCKITFFFCNVNPFLLWIWNLSAFRVQC